MKQKRGKKRGSRAVVPVMFLITLIIVLAGGVGPGGNAEAQFTVTTCADCHANPPVDGTRDATTGAVIGSHGLADHDASNCGNCHVEPGATEYNHRNTNIEMSGTIHGQTGSSYSKGTSFAQTNSPVLGSCLATYCHGTGSDLWGTDLSAYDTCTKCHGEKTASPTDPQKAPGGAGVDTNNESSNADAQVGAHQVHLTAADNISSAIACGECHTVPTAPDDAGHWDSSGPRDAAELTFAGPIGDTDGNGVDLTITYSSGQCSNTYCHDGRNFKNGWSTAAQIDYETPTWNSPMISTPDGDGICDNCHGYPPAGAHFASADCSSCHDHVDATDDGFTGVNIAKHINHVVESQAGCNSCHSYKPDSADGKPYMEVNDVAPTANEGKGAHVKHVNHIEALYVAGGGSALDAANDSFGDIKTTAICGVCHNMNVANHDIDGNGTRDINFNGSIAYQFGTSVPDYNGVPGDFGVNFAKTCSNVSCHFQASPEWQSY